MALANIRERLALHFDAEAGLESKVNQGDIRSAYPDAVSDSFGRQERAWLTPR